MYRIHVQCIFLNDKLLPLSLVIFTLTWNLLMILKLGKTLKLYQRYLRFIYYTYNI